jgi:predicted RNase H-like nuclease (RuvC/YqgF family)
MDKEKESEKNEKVDDATEAGDLQRENEVMINEIKTRDAVILKLEQELTAKESEITALKKELDELKQAIDEANKATVQAVAAYKEMAAQANPGLPSELISGDTIAAISESLKNACTVVEKVRQEMEAEASRTRIPAGAPRRSVPDLSGLSPREKIQQGLK